MHRVFLDANHLFSAAYKADSRLLELWRLRDTVLCSSRYAVEEARVNLARERQQRLQKLSERLKLFEAADRALPRGISLPRRIHPFFWPQSQLALLTS